MILKIEDSKNIEFFSAVFQNGWIVLEKVGFLALYILENSIACQRYLKARFSHIIVDEYQDCGFLATPNYLLKLVNLGLIGIAVG